MTDEQFAKWLQDEEFRQQREATGTRSAQNEQRLATERADEEYARRLAAAQLHNTPRQPPENAIALQHGQTVAVRLQHPGTRNQIDEALYAHHVDHNIMMFEMVRNRGTYLRIKDSSEAEFSKVVDEASQFAIENCAGGLLYLGPRKHNQKVNLSGSVGWMLALSHNGSLIGNAARNTMSQWRLLAAPDAPPYTPLQTPAGSGRGSVPVPSSQQPNSDSVSNPLMVAESSEHTFSASQNNNRRSARVKSVCDWLDSSVGQTWLSQDREGRGQLKQMYLEGKLQKLVYRPDWPKAALEWKDYSKFHNDHIVHDMAAENNNVNFGQFFNKGYTICRGAVNDPRIINNALKVVNYWLGQYPNHPAINASGNIDLCGEILHDQSLLALLYETSLLPLARDFFKDNIVLKPCLECQVCLRFPDYCSVGPESHPGFNFSGKRWHIDNKCDPGVDGGYALLVGIPLSSTAKETESEGNLCLFPGKQRDVFDAWCSSRIPGSGGEAVIAAMTDIMDMSKPDFGEPDVLHVNEGDVVFISPFSPRREAPNFSPHTNYMVCTIISDEPFYGFATNL